MHKLPKSVTNMATRFDKLNETQLQKFLKATYVDRKMSPKEIADLCDTYTNKIRRTIKKCGYELRGRSAAQSVAIEQGRHPHPTKGVGHSDESKVKISEGASTVWENLSDEEREHRSMVSKQQWDAMSDAEKNMMREKAGNAVREAAKKGSKLEHFLFRELERAGYQVDFHKEHFISNERLTVDLYIPIIKTAIEVDGPSHFSPIWGEETLARNIRADAQKDGLLLGMGLCVVRLCQKKGLSEKFKRDILAKLLGRLDAIKKKFPAVGYRHITIGDENDV